MDPSQTLRLLDRIEAKTIRTRTCWLWHGALDKDGYGNIHCLGRWWRLPRLVLILDSGDDHIADGLEVDHVCGIRNCIRPEHLEVVTLAVNRARKRGMQYKTGKPFVLLQPGSVAAQRWERRNPHLSHHP